MVLARRALLAAACVTLLLLLLPAQLPAQDPAGPSVGAESAMSDFAAAVQLESRLKTAEARNAFGKLYRALQACPEVGKPEGRTQRVLAEACLMRFTMLSFQLGATAVPEGMLNGTTPILADKDRLAGVWMRLAQGDLEQAQQAEESFHWLTRWTLIGPFRNDSGVGFDTEYEPESSEPPGLGEKVAGAAREVGWRQLPVMPFMGEVVLDDFMAPDAKVVSYAVSVLVNHTEKPLDLALRLGTTGAWRVWLNGAELASKDVRRDANWMDQEAVGLPLQPGLNRLMLKLCVEEHEWRFGARLTRPDGAPLSLFEVSEVPFGDPEKFAKDWEASFETTARSDRVAVSRGPADELFDDQPLAAVSPAWRDYLCALFHQTYEYEDAKARKAAEYLEKAVEKEPDTALWHFAASKVAGEVAEVEHEREENRVRDHLEKAVAADPEMAGAWLGLANYYLSINRLDDAKEAIDTASRLAPGSSALIAPRVQLLRQRRYQPDVDAIFTGLWKRFEADAASLNATELGMLMSFLGNEGRRADREAVVRQRLAQDGRDKWTRFDLIRTAMQRGQLDDAQAQLDVAKQLWPSSLSVLGLQRAVYEAAANWEAAAQTDERGLEFCPHNEQLWIQLGKDRFTAEDEEAANVAWRRALELNPTNSWLKEYFAFLEEGGEKAWADKFIEDVSGYIAEAKDLPMKDDFPADVIYDQEILRVERDGRSRNYHHRLMRITNEDGTRQMRQVHAGGGGDSRVLEARIHHPDGTREDARISQWGRIDFGTNLKIGDILEYRVRSFAGNSPVFGDYFGTRFLFQEDVPMHHYRLVLIWPKDKPIGMHPQSLVDQAEVSVDESEGVKVWKWSQDNIPELQAEPGMPPANELVPTLEISTYRTWDEFAIWYWNLIRKQVLVTDDIREAVASVTAGAPEGDIVERIRRIYEFVANELRYNDAWEFGVHGYQPFTAQAILRRKFGDCKDKAILICAMLSCIGVKAHPVIIRSAWRRGEEDITLPLIQHFNHAIALVEWPDGTERFLDGTAVFHPVDTIPGSDAGAKTLVVYPDKGRIVQVPWTNPEDNATRDAVTITLQEDGDATFDETRHFNAQAGAEQRWRYENTERRKDMEDRRWGTVLPGAKVNTIDLTDPKALTEACVQTTKVTATRFLRRDGEALTFRPVSFAHSFTRTPYASMDKRKYDLLVGPPRGEYRDRTFIVPAGYTPVSLPEPVELDTPFAFFRMSCEFADGKLVVSTAFGFKQHRVLAADYPTWRDMATQIDRAEQTTIRLEKAR